MTGSGVGSCGPDWLAVLFWHDCDNDGEVLIVGGEGTLICLVHPHNYLKIPNSLIVVHWNKNKSKHPVQIYAYENRVFLFCTVSYTCSYIVNKGD